jgi:hypothetical protein
MTYNYENIDIIYFSSQEEGKYDVDISQLLEDILYKDIPFDALPSSLINSNVSLKHFKG